MPDYYIITKDELIALAPDYPRKDTLGIICTVLARPYSEPGALSSLGKAALKAANAAGTAISDYANASQQPKRGVKK